MSLQFGNLIEKLHVRFRSISSRIVERFATAATVIKTDRSSRLRFQQDRRFGYHGRFQKCAAEGVEMKQRPNQEASIGTSGHVIINQLGDRRPIEVFVDR